MSDYNQILASGAEALIPEAISNEIIKEMPKQSASLQMFRQVPMSTKSVRQRVLSMLPVAYFVSGNTGLKKTTNAGWENKYLIAEELAVIIPIPENVLDDAEIDIWEEVKPLLVEAFGAKLDAAIFFGEDKPSSWGDSVVDHAANAGNEVVRASVTDQDLAGDVNDVMTLVESDGFSVTGFIARNTVKGSLRGLRDKNGGLLYLPSLQVGVASTLYGENLAYLENGSWDDALADLIAVNRQKGIIGLRRDITMKRFDTGVITDDEGQVIYNLLQQDMVAFRAVMRVAWQIANPVTRMNQNAATRSPFGVLRPADFA